MNLATIFILGLAVLVLGVYLLRRESRQKDVRGLKTSGLLLGALGAIGVGWVIAAVVLFVLNP